MNDIESTPSSWQGVYKTWEEAKGEGKGFLSKRWKDRIVQQLLDYRMEKNLYGNASPPRPSDLPFFCSLVNPRSIVDFGGSSGWLWDYIQDCNVNNLIEQYDIIENDELCEYFRNSDYHYSPVNYITLNECVSNYDILYANSTIQYIDNHIVLELISLVKPKYILIEDFFGGNIEDYFTLQNYYEDSIPTICRNLNKFIKIVNNLGFECLNQKTYVGIHRGKVQPLPMSGVPKSKRIRYGKSLLFKRI